MTAVEFPSWLHLPGWLEHLAERVVLGNTILQWFLATVVFLGTLVVLRVVKRVLVRRLEPLAERTRTTVDDLVVDLVRRTHGWFLAVAALYLGALVLTLPPATDRLATGLFSAALFFQAGIWAVRAGLYGLELLVGRRAEGGASRGAVLDLFTFFVRLGVWTVVLLLVLDNLGLDVTALITGLGIGGVAVALAVQNILGDIFASVSILLDKPFEVGDFIIVGDLLGTVENIGIKTTRIRSLSGEQLVFGNKDLLSSRIRNFKRMYERRVVFGFGVTYETPADKVEAIPVMVREIVEAREQTRFDRAHFKGFGDSSLDFEVVYYVLVPDYNVYMDIQQAINLAILRRFEAEEIDFAYPTRTIHMAGGTPPSALHPG